MHMAGLILSWVLGILSGVLTLSMVLMGALTQAVPLLGLTLLLLPPVRGLIERQTGFTFSLPVIGLAAVALRVAAP